MVKEFQVNTNTISKYHLITEIKKFNNDQFIISWFNQQEITDSTPTVSAQKFNSDGTKSGSEFQFDISPYGSYCSMAVLNNDKFVAAFVKDVTPYHNDTEIYAQTFNNDGTKFGEEFHINTYTDGMQGYPSMATLSNGKFLSTWTSRGQDGSGDGVYAQIFNNDGTKFESEFQVNSYTAGNQYKSVATSLIDGRFVVAWEDAGQDGSGDGVYAQIFNNDGTKRGTEFQVNTHTEGTQQDIGLTSLQTGGFLVAWESDDGSGDDKVYAQLFNSDGSKSGSEFQMNTYQECHYPKLVELSNNKLVGTWYGQGQDNGGGEYPYEVSAQIFNSDGTKSGSEFQVNTYTYNFQGHQSISTLNNGGFIIAFAGSNWDGSDSTEIYAQMFDANGQRIEPGSSPDPDPDPDPDDSAAFSNEGLSTLLVGAAGLFLAEVLL